ncbi:hypothetical protein RF11_15764 [Thelohanellus kitauei]|uniref:Uncharacterized protein n=1 Tax=Thelohanellus kitauei TaxID=669202 RepID=A0A0C2N613_THEKT|nr:hypothetical protein RF11_15764 [Thelohanellus kitauei]
MQLTTRYYRRTQRQIFACIMCGIDEENSKAENTAEYESHRYSGDTANHFHFLDLDHVEYVITIDLTLLINHEVYRYIYALEKIHHYLNYYLFDKFEVRDNLASMVIF